MTDLSDPTRDLIARLERAERRLRLYRALYASTKNFREEYGALIDELLSWNSAEPSRKERYVISDGAVYLIREEAEEWAEANGGRVYRIEAEART